MVTLRPPQKLPAGPVRVRRVPALGGILPRAARLNATPLGGHRLSDSESCRMSLEPSTGRAVVVRDYEAQYADPIAVPRDAEVLVERDDPEFPGWWWCSAPDGRAGWVPVELLAAPCVPGVPARLLADYSACELTVCAGTVLDVLEERSRWTRARTAEGLVGWLPTSHVRLVAPAT
jgi:hypothetical protein